MKIQRKSLLSGRVATMDVPCTQQQLDDWTLNGKHIQEAMPNVPAELREFLLTGITPDEWKTLVDDGEGDEYTGPHFRESDD